ncbi:hypothetical protein CGRA01v4_01415 [Colletotrichum graminicola]|nr:hypothetical protein CGRA01v4_01415 [Colletotrichum graminicola]
MILMSSSCCPRCANRAEILDDKRPKDCNLFFVCPFRGHFHDCGTTGGTASSAGIAHVVRPPPVTRQCNYPAEPTSFHRGTGEHAPGAVSRRPEDRTAAESSDFSSSFLSLLACWRNEWESPGNVAKVSLRNRA